MGRSNLLYRISQLFAGLEFHDFFGRYLHLLSSLWILAGPGGSVDHGKGAEANQGNFLSPGKGIDHSLHESLQGSAGIRFTQFSELGNGAD